jgi:hypothetical protein
MRPGKTNIHKAHSVVDEQRGRAEVRKRETEQRAESGNQRAASREQRVEGQRVESGDQKLQWTVL